MAENNNEQPKKQGLSKGIIAIIIAVIVLAGGGAAAFFLTANSPKATYFQAEKNSMEQIIAFFENRYEDESDWAEQSMEKPVSQQLDLSLNLDSLANDPYFAYDPTIAMLSNAKLTLNSQTDIPGKEIYGDMALNLGGIEFKDIAGYISGSDMYFQVPFLDEVIKVSDDDIGSILYELDPYVFTGEEKLDIEKSLFDESLGLLSEEEKEYLKDEYLMFIYDELPDDAFDSEKEKVKVNGESFNAEKITMNLSEDQFKSIIVSTIEKMKEDDKFKEILKGQLEHYNSDITMTGQSLDDVIAEFEPAMDQLVEGIESLELPKGLQSTLWVSDDKVVKRDFNLNIGQEGFDPVDFTIAGEELYTDDQVYFDYTFNVDDEFPVQLKGDFQGSRDTVTDTAELTIPDIFTVTYNGEESVDGSTRNFDRQFDFTELEYNETVNLAWTGDSNYEGDQMNSSHTISFNMPAYGLDEFGLNIDIEGTVIDSVEGLDDSNVVDLGSMSAAELQDYFENDFYNQLDSWLLQFGF